MAMPKTHAIGCSTVAILAWLGLEKRKKRFYDSINTLFWGESTNKCEYFDKLHSLALRN